MAIARLVAPRLNIRGHRHRWVLVSTMLLVGWQLVSVASLTMLAVPVWTQEALASADDELPEGVYCVRGGDCWDCDCCDCAPVCC